MSHHNEGFDKDYDLSEYPLPRINSRGNTPQGSPKNNYDFEGPLLDINEKIPTQPTPDISFDPEREKISAREAKRNQRISHVQKFEPPPPDHSIPLQTNEKLKRKKSEKFVSSQSPQPSSSFPSVWTIYCRVITFFAPNSLLKFFGMNLKESRVAWREKIGLVSLIVLMCTGVGFLTFGLQQILCHQTVRIKNTDLGSSSVVINGNSYNIFTFSHPPSALTGTSPSILDPPASAGFSDLSLMFQNPNTVCKKVLTYKPGFADANGNVVNVFPCVKLSIGQTDLPQDSIKDQACHNSATARAALSSIKSTQVSYTWSEVKKNSKYVIYNGAILDLNRVSWFSDQVNIPSLFLRYADGSYGGHDISLDLSNFDPNIGKCMFELFKIGYVDTSPLGCIATNIILYVSLIVILGAVFAKFFMATYFGWFMSRKLGKLSQETPEQRRIRLEAIDEWENVNNHYGQEPIVQKYFVQNGLYESRKKSRFFLPTSSRYSRLLPGEEPGSRERNRKSRILKNTQRKSALNTPLSTYLGNQTQSGPFALDAGEPVYEIESSKIWPESKNIAVGPKISSDDSQIESPIDADLLYTFLMVTCYSEGARGIRTTLDSLVRTDYSSRHKCLFVVCDGIIKGEGESISTPDVCLSMMHNFVIPPDRVQAFSYVSVAMGSKRHNMAKLYAGYYLTAADAPEELKKKRVPMILVVKCGTPNEATDKKPGNRGKRDSQVILMSFLQRVMFDERMTRLEYEMFNAIWNITGVTPDNFEIVLMVDADTKVYPDSLAKMISVMANDHMVMGLCGETKIANKSDSYTSMMQVFEYYISHHLSKSFESVFGGVTCLPGCFCMYRIKAPKGQHGYWVPILANPDVVENYSENVVDTLHKKNLYLLGEDRYLSTLMLKSFPKRKMTFVPSAVCKTIVPNEFKVLLSQRRRWINSTVHNLFELVLVNDLCGTFCFSMQFMIFMELIGTLVLPAAIVFTLYIIVISFIIKPVPYLPLALLAIILGLPAILIGLTSRKVVYIGWMFVYLSALVLWNFVLPVYAFWHFDDFSWGDTRKIHGESKGDAHDVAEGEFDSSNIVMKRWCGFEAEKRKYAEMILSGNPNFTYDAQDASSSFGQADYHHPGNNFDTPNRISVLFNMAQNNHNPDITDTFESIQQLGYHVPLARPSPQFHSTPRSSPGNRSAAGSVKSQLHLDRSASGIIIPSRFNETRPQSSHAYGKSRGVEGNYAPPDAFSSSDFLIGGNRNSSLANRHMYNNEAGIRSAGSIQRINNLGPSSNGHDTNSDESPNRDTNYEHQNKDKGL
ncbi:hypothetical protein BB558_006736 [Smittium angustum]|uniref:chitin synthase n=1 Tax=Smittium angustum TaxID=133377 RepID=A0A2U1IVK2_SMIAN|nr:hypothetical protein BB558_007255 [Smittium angustum]PVZ97308.1 hypothetical protein BB558_006736 [Smittium angustum]